MLEKKVLIWIGIANIAISCLALGIFIGSKLTENRYECDCDDYDRNYDEDDDYYGLEDFDEGRDS